MSIPEVRGGQSDWFRMVERSFHPRYPNAIRHLEADEQQQQTTTDSTAVGKEQETEALQFIDNTS